MAIAIGTTNVVKIEAVEEVIKDYPHFANVKIHTFSVPSEVGDQPLSLHETIRGAKNRARHAYTACGSCRYSFGIESGLFEATGSQTGFLEATICCIYDGKNYHIGISSGFEVPPQILDLVINKKLDLGQACYQSGFTTNAKLGAAEGIVGMLTKGRVNRKLYTKQAVTMALVQLENGEWYSKSES